MTLNRGKALRTTQEGLVWLIAALSIVLASARGKSQGVTTTTVQGTVYLATGKPGSGTLVIKWPAFTTASGEAIAADTLTSQIGPDGFVSVNLAPNQGATPAGLYYTAVYYMSDGSTSTEYWVVPAAAQVTLAQVRAQVMPAAQAVQAVTKSYVDQQLSELMQSQLSPSGGSLSGPLYLNGDPSQSLQAADKHYVDSQVANAVQLAGGTMIGSLVLNGDPSQDLQAADKRYVDGAAAAAWPGAVLRADRFSGADFGAKLQACVNAVDSTYGGTCDARNFSGNLSMAANVTIPAANTSVLLPCATITTAAQIVVPGGVRDVALRGCAQRGGSAASGSAGGTAFAYSGAGPLVQVGDPAYAVDTPGFHMDNVVIDTTGASSAAAQGLAAYRTQELDLEGLYLLGNANQTGMTLDGTGNYTGGTFLGDQFVGFQTAVNGIGHQTSNSATTDWLNASTFVRMHIDCPTQNGVPIAGTFGINLQQGDGNTFTGGDVENCATALHLGSSAQNNTIVGLRNENSTYQVVADSGSTYNNWITGGTIFTGRLVDNGTRNSFLDTFHRSFNALNGDWYGSQQDATLTNHYRLGTGAGNERGLLNRYQTDSGYRWTMGLSDATSGEQFYQILDELNNVYRFSAGQYNGGQASTNNQTVINAAGTGAVVLNGSTNAGTGGIVIGSGGPSSSTVATISNTGNAQFTGTLQVGGTAQSVGTMTVRNSTDAEVDYYLWPGLTASQKGSFTYKDFNGNSQWYMVKDQSNNWALNSAVGGLDSFKAYQSTNSGDTYINASNTSGAVRVNYEDGSGSSFRIYGGNSASLYASFAGANSIAFPGLAASSGHSCLQIDNSGYITNTGAACGTGDGSGTVGNGSTGQIAYYTDDGTAIGGTSAVPLTSGGTGATTADAALQNLGALPQSGGTMTGALNGTSASFSGPVQSASFTGAGTGLTGTAAALNIGGNAATSNGLSGNPSVNVSNVTASGAVTAFRVNASVNSRINVMAPPYSAKGDCKTNDQAAIQQALDAAALTSPWATVEFPTPPGGCYLTGTLTWRGQSLVGLPPVGGGKLKGATGVLLEGLPEQDILHEVDPNSSSATVESSWSIRNISFLVDNSVDASANFPHRWPGRWVTDASMTAGSAAFTSPHSMMSCSDIGQPILVKGAGASGADLVTTIASVSPCWSDGEAQTISLTATAGTTVSNAIAYISVANIPAAQTIGNCAIAADNRDGNTADWMIPPAGNGSDNLQNISIAFTASSPNHSCAIYFQGARMPYAMHAARLYERAPAGNFGIVEGLVDTNPMLGTNGADYQTWEEGWWSGSWPWISYGSDFVTMRDIQLYASNGPQILGANGSLGNAEPIAWYIRVPEFESPTQGGIGWRIRGRDMWATGIELCAGENAYLDTSSSVFNGASCNQLGGSGSLTIAGYSNTISASAANIDGLPPIVDVGAGNTFGAEHFANPAYGRQPATQRSFTKSRGYNYLAGSLNGDFLKTGNGLNFYPNGNDLLWMPEDIDYGGVATVEDSASPTGRYVVHTAGTRPAVSLFPNNQPIIGTQIPAAEVTFYAMVKCAGPSTPTLTVYAGSSAVATLPNFSCGTSYSTIGRSVNLSGYVGQALSWAYNNTVDEAWVGIAPHLNANSVNGLSATGGGTALTTGPSTTVSGHCAQFDNATGQIGDSGAPCGSTGGYPAVVYTLADTTYAGTAGVPQTVAYTTPNDGKIHLYRFEWYHVITTASTGGNSFGEVWYTAHGNSQARRLTGNVATTTQWNDSMSVSPMSQNTVEADPNTKISYSLVENSVTGGTPTISYAFKIIDLGPVQ